MNFLIFISIAISVLSHGLLQAHECADPPALVSTMGEV